MAKASKWRRMGWLAGCLLLLQGAPAAASSARPPVQPAMPYADVLIDAGHGGIDGGTTYGDILEKQINLQIAERVYQLLRKKGISAALDRTGDYALSDDNRWMRSRSRHLRDLAQRKHVADSLRPVVLVSLHVNWSKHADESGPLVLHQGNYNSVVFARVIQSSLNELYGSAEQPRSGKTFYLLKHAPCTAIIVEMGFISNRDDRKRLTTAHGQKEIAGAIATGIHHYLHLRATSPDGVSYP
ncbi:MAG: N-acetylmuramoyl-L-alanine amidase [Paenibacillaceae bacterium]|nr:N-acetylmuramoyl-L-alanine amidase [Paenibacillaceae bacterium]